MKREITLKEIWDFIKSNLLKLLIGFLVGAAIAFTFAKFLISPTYISQAQLLVNQGTTEEQPVQYSQIQTNVTLINTYRDIILADATLNDVNNELDNKYSVGSLKSALSVAQNANSQAFTITAEMSSPVVANEVVSKVVEVFEERVSEAYRTNNPDIFVLSEASYSSNPVSPNTPLITALGAIIGLGITTIYNLVIMLSDTTIRDTDYLDAIGITNLGEINSMSKKTRNNTRLTSSALEPLIRRKV